jgi:DNA-binding winged helix-turn-helix (wHTH) protein
MKGHSRIYKVNGAVLARRAAHRQVFRFGQKFLVDLTAYQLLESGRPIHLPRIPMEILRVLVQRHGQLVSREEMIRLIWGSDPSVDVETNLNEAIRRIRRALGDNPERPQFIKTVYKKGYRFDARVQTKR